MAAKNIFIILIFISISGCDSTLNGNIFLTTGSGQVVPVAGRDVYLIPYSSEEQFISEIANESYSYFIPYIKNLISKECLIVIKEADRKLSEIRKNHSIENTQDTYPDTKCNKIEENKSEIEELQAKIVEKTKVMENTKNDFFIQNKKNVTVKILRQKKYKVYLQVTNNSDYCIRGYGRGERHLLNVIGLSNKVKIGDWNEAFSHSDSEGRSIPCSLPPKAAVNLVTLAFGNGNEYPTITSAYLANFEFYKMELSKNKYKTSKVDWYKESKNTNHNSQEIKNIKDNLESLKTIYTEKLVHCKEEKNTIEKSKEKTDIINKYIGEIENLTLEMKKCDIEKIEPEHLLNTANKLTIKLKENEKGKERLSFYSSLNEPADEKEFPVYYILNAWINTVLKQKISAENAYITTTGMDGSFEINNVESGKYMIISSYTDAFNNSFWLEHIEITSDKKHDMTNQNSKSRNIKLYIESKTNEEIEKHHPEIRGLLRQTIDYSSTLTKPKSY
ncbi:MAG: hypothetical protein V7739_20165 [Motiliproteus sp.]